MSGGSVVSENDDAAMRLLHSDHFAFIGKPLEIFRMSRVMVFDSPIVYSQEIVQTLSLCIPGYKGPQGTTENGDIFREVITSPIEQDECAQRRVR